MKIHSVPFTTLGEGGAATTNDAEFAEKVRWKKTFGYVYGTSLRVVTVGDSTTG